MIDVGVRQEHRVEARPVEGRDPVIADLARYAALVKTEVDEDAGPPGLDQRAGACDLAGGAEERELHADTVPARTAPKRRTLRAHARLGGADRRGNRLRPGAAQHFAFGQTGFKGQASEDVLVDP